MTFDPLGQLHTSYPLRWFPFKHREIDNGNSTQRKTSAAWPLTHSLCTAVVAVIPTTVILTACETSVIDGLLNIKHWKVVNCVVCLIDSEAVCG